MDEARTQCYVSDAFRQKGDKSTVKVPEIYHAFECEGLTYILMEYINVQTFGTLLKDPSTDRQWIYDQMAKAVNQVIHLPVPEGSIPGPVGGGYIQHPFFQDETAPTKYSSVDELQRHINKVLRSGRSKQQVDFSHENLCLCYSDIWQENFLRSKTGQVYIIDFQHVAFLPTSFMNFAVYKTGRLLLSKISARISIPESVNLEAMGRASYILKISADNRIGL